MKLLRLGVLFVFFSFSSEMAIPNNGLAEPSATQSKAEVEKILKNSICDIWRDPQEIPHIHAKGELEGLACLGYIHGRDRSWEMDYFRKSIQGRRAEFF